MAEFGDIRINDTLTLPAWEVSEAFVRASGPGGQNVKTRFAKLYANRITKDGRLVLEASEHRSQALNREAARKRLAEMILRASRKPKRRIKTKPTYGSVKRRIAAKKRRGEIKALRGNVDPTD